ncbi:MAG: Na/Pi cotransporter family protein [Cloacibacillus sp.]
MSVTSVLQVLAGVGILIYGIIIMGDSLQIIAGDRLRRLIGSLTGTPIKGLMVGTVVTSILQSSSATTVMVVSFVDVGFMNLTQAIGVILGANIGTTVTGQLIAFKITNFAYLCAVVGAAICILCHKKRHKQIGVGIIGFALLFIGMEMMQQPMSFLKTRPDLLMAFGNHPMLAFLAGLVITLIVQSSSATVGLTMAVAAQGVIPLHTAIIIILGDNIGTTITAVLASLGANRAAKQAAAAHVMIKVLGTVAIMMVLPAYTLLIAMTADNISRQVANAHTIFNIIIAFMFLPFVAQYAKFIRKIIPDDKNVVESGSLYLNPALITASSAAAVDAVRKEMIRLAQSALQMIVDCRILIIENKEKYSDEVGRYESNVNELTHEIVRYSTEVGQTGLSRDLSLLLNSCTNAVGDVERIGDHATNLVEMSQYLQDHKLTLSRMALEEGNEMFELVITALTKSIQALEEENIELAKEVIALEERIDYMEKTLRAQHIARLNAGGCTPGAGVIFIDILSNLERVGDHANNLAMVVFDIERLRHHDKAVKA